MQTDFEYAYYLYLTGGDYKPRMIACAVDALLNRMDGEYLTILAGADDEDNETTLRYFRKASTEVGLNLPEKEEEEAWHLTKYYQFMAEGRPMPTEDLNRRFERNLMFISVRLSQFSDLISVLDFAEHFSKYSRKAIGIKYEHWLGKLGKLRAVVWRSDAPERLKQIVNGVTDLINDVSYGGADDSLWERSQALAESLMVYSDIYTRARVLGGNKE